MDYDFAVLSDDDLVKLEERQDLSQYSYDPTDTMELVGTDLPFACESSQPSSQEKLFDSDYLTTPCDRNPTDNGSEIDLLYLLGDAPSMEQPLPFVPFGNTAVDQQIVDSKSGIVDPIHTLVDNELHFDVTSPSTSSSASRVPDSTSYFGFDLEELETSECSLVSDKELLTLATRELNRKIRHFSPEQQQQIKSRRRTLKNRGYAQTCRTRRIGQRSQLEHDKICLNDEVQKLKDDNDQLNAERDRLRKEVAQYKKERDIYQSRLQELVNVLAANGYVVQEID